MQGKNARVPTVDDDDDDHDDNEGRLLQSTDDRSIQDRGTRRTSKSLFSLKNVARSMKINGDKVINLAVLVTRGRIWKNLGEKEGEDRELSRWKITVRDSIRGQHPRV